MERYDGYFFRIIKKAIDGGALRDDIDIVILSAEFGLLDLDDSIPMYDRQMTSKRAGELREDVLSSLVSRVRTGEYDTLVVNMAKEYQRAIEGIDSKLEIDINRIRGGGIGAKGRKLKHLIRSDYAIQEGIA
jgi:hypothetical protein